MFLKTLHYTNMQAVAMPNNNPLPVGCKNKNCEAGATQQLGSKFCFCIHVSAKPTRVKGGCLLRLCSPHSHYRLTANNSEL